MFGRPGGGQGRAGPDSSAAKSRPAGLARGSRGLKSRGRAARVGRPMRSPQRNFLLSGGAIFLMALASGCWQTAPDLPPEEVVKVPAGGSVVVYVEATIKTAGPILKTFQEQTGIIVT